MLESLKNADNIGKAIDAASKNCSELNGKMDGNQAALVVGILGIGSILVGGLIAGLNALTKNKGPQVSHVSANL